MKTKSLIGIIFGVSLVLMIGFSESVYAGAPQLCFSPTCTTGNFYVANSGDGTVKLFDSAGGPPIDSDWAADAVNYIPTISHHKAVAVDSAGNVYVGFGGPHNIVMKFDSAGNVLDPNFAATPVAMTHIIDAITIDSADNLYLSYTAPGHASVMKFDSTGTEVLPRFIPGGVIGNTVKIEFDSDGNLNLLDLNAAAVRKFDPSGTEILPTFIPGLNQPLDFAFDSAGNVYVSVNALDRVEQYDSSGTLLNAAFATSMIFPRAITFDSDGLLYVVEADSGWNTVRQYAATGGTPIDSSFATGLNSPRDMVFATQQVPNVLEGTATVAGACEVNLASGTLGFTPGDPISNGAGVGTGEISEVLTNGGNLQSNVGVYGTDWTGVGTWIAQTSGTTNTFRSVSAVDANTAWAVGDSGLILKTTDGGSTWITQTSGTTERLWDVSAVDDQTAWASGDNDVILKTTDGGTNWVVPSGTLPPQVINLYGVSAVSDQIAWASGDGGFTVIKTVDGGNNWTYHPASNHIWYDIEAIDDQTAWAVGSEWAIAKTTNGGASWVTQLDLVTSDRAFNDITIVDTNVAWVGGGITTPSSIPEIRYTTNGGTTWTPQTIPSLSIANIRGMDSVDANTAWAVGNSGEILHTTNAGTTWTLQTSGTTSTMTEISAVDANTAWAVGDLGKILHTTNGGEGVTIIMDGSHTVVSTSTGNFASKGALSTSSGSPTALGNIAAQGSITSYWDVEIVMDGGNPGYSGATVQTITVDFTCV